MHYRLPITTYSLIPRLLPSFGCIIYIYIYIKAVEEPGNRAMMTLMAPEQTVYVTVHEQET